MNNKQKILSLMTIVILCLAISVFSFLQQPTLKEKIINQKESQANIDAFLSSDHSNEYINTVAYEAISKKFEKENDYLYSYRAKEGFEIVSYSETWNEAKLVELYEELLKNKHGKEIELLYQIIVYDHADEYAAGTHLSTEQILSWTLSFPIMPNIYLNFSEDMGIISLYDGNRYSTVEDMANTLSHEYGHHFTDYYIFTDDYYPYYSTDYETIRNFPDNKVKKNIDDYDEYMENHEWYIMEIAAEDYIQLMGSETAKKVVKFVDINQSLYGAKHPKIFDGYNASPQENMMLPLAYEVDGLYDYFNSFISDDYESAPLLPEKQDSNLQITKGSSHHESTDGPLNFTHYKLSWDNPYGEGVTYTISCYSEDDYYIYPIKTVYPGDSRVAYIGTVSRETATSIYWYYDELAKGTKTFIVTALFPDGSIIVADTLEYTFR